jgi:hypothetical protein
MQQAHLFLFFPKSVMILHPSREEIKLTPALHMAVFGIETLSSTITGALNRARQTYVHSIPNFLALSAVLPTYFKQFTLNARAIFILLSGCESYIKSETKFKN